ncbi:alkaline phosphatase [Aphanothece hegewaldii CCALA 016]|uniref:Alkaline phosphatase n=1 Tax=Aphanothece hegewaldii CCALA 016 TaxID=2107694 RepID=A0A2T1LXB4_9CHRO|nr:choice-of-anchor I family protein [Aphanothece hegewaldii]PSF36829.1 alkaline phosphatase [Aphanothece hegewaldii CCALA 016]
MSRSNSRFLPFWGTTAIITPIVLGTFADQTLALNLTRLGTYVSPDGEGAAEISAYDPISKNLFITNGSTNSIDILNISNPSVPSLISSINLNTYGAGVNSVAVKNGLVAVAIGSDPKTNPGTVAFFNTSGSFLNSVTVGALPDMLTFTSDGSKILVANEGEPEPLSISPTVDPEGSISIIDLSGGVGSATVNTADFTAFNSQKAALQAAGVRIFGQNGNATVAEDVEPEYIAISKDNKKAYVSLQENNALAVLDIDSATITDILPLGLKNYNTLGNGLDASDEDGGINIQNWPISGMYMPDSIATVEINGQTYIITANEGDDRGENERISDLTLDPTAFPNAAQLLEDENLGRLNVSSVDGDLDKDGDFDVLYSYGGRSFSIWDSNGNLIYDSGDAFEQITASLIPSLFNSEGEAADFDSRSDNKGPEPEGLTVGKIGDRFYAFIGLERTGGLMVYDITNPLNPTFVTYTRTEGDFAPEGVLFIPSIDSPTNQSLVITTNEVSGTTTIYAAATTPEPTTGLGLLILGIGGILTKVKKKSA